MERLSVVAGVLRGHDVLDLIDRPPVDREEYVAWMDAGVGGACTRRYLSRNDVPCRRAPQDTIFDLVPRRSLRDIRAGKTEEEYDDAQVGRRPHPHALQPDRNHCAYKLYPAEDSKAHTPAGAMIPTGKYLNMGMLSSRSRYAAASLSNMT
jgi:hypothetical protein